MLRNYAHDQGLKQGVSDAFEGRAAKPRPSLTFSLLSEGYLTEYQKAYRLAYTQAERRHAQDLAAKIERRDHDLNARAQALIQSRANQTREREPRSR